MRTELKRWTITESRWSRNEVSRESPETELNRRPTSLRKFRADAFRGPWVSMATGWKIRSEGRVEYLDSFLTLAASAALPAERDVDCKTVLLLLLLQNLYSAQVQACSSRSPITHFYAFTFHSHYISMANLNLIPIPMGILWDLCHSSIPHSHAHL